MNTPQIKDMNDLRANVTYLTTNIHAMCNAQDVDGVVAAFMLAKEQLVAVYKFNVERLIK